LSRLLNAIIFDLDGVITDTAEYHYLAWKDLADELNISFSRELNEQLKGISRMGSLEIILKSAGKEQEYSELAKIELAERKNQLYQSLIAKITPADILPNIKQLITDIRAKGIRLGLASVSKNAFTVMEKLKLTDLFETIVDASTIKNGKPDPEIFLTAAQLLNVDPTACIGIEDAAAGVESIKRAGMYAIGIGSPAILAQADIVYTSTSELTLERIITNYQ